MRTEPRSQKVPEAALCCRSLHDVPVVSNQRAPPPTSPPAQRARRQLSLPSPLVSPVLSLRHASQTVRVGYGRFISDLVEQVKIARTKATPPQNTADSSSSSSSAARDGTGENLQQPKVSSERLKNDGGGRRGGGPGTLVMGTAGGAAGAMALMGLQRFGGKCIRALAD